MKRTSALALVAAALLAGPARADLVPDNHRGVKLSIRVDADVPSGKALILAHTFRALDVVKPGAVADVEWHPMAGQMVIMSVPASSVTDKVEQQRKDLDRAPLEAIVKSGKPCHEGFNGVRTVPVSAPAHEIRWNYRVSFSGDGCTAVLAKMEFFDKSGNPVDGTDIPDLPAAAAAASTAGVRPASTAGATGTGTGTGAAAQAAPAATPSGQAAGGGCSCMFGPGAASSERSIPTGGPLALLTTLGLVLAARRRKSGR